MSFEDKEGLSDLNTITNEIWFNEDARFYKDVYIYGTLYYEFESNGLEKFNDIQVEGSSTFNGPATFNNDVTISGNLVVGILTVTQRLDVGVDGTTLRAINSTGNVGIGSTIPQQKLDVAGSVKINSQIYDATNSAGVIGAFLTKDAEGIKWTEFEPSFIEGIFVYNEGVLVGPSSYRGLNLKTGRGSGVSTDPIQGTINPSSSNIVDITVTDYWDFVTGSTSIYRNSNVGINNSNPTVALDVVGSVNITQSLNVDGATTLNSTLDVDGNVTFNSNTESTSKDSGAVIIDGGVGIEKRLNVGGAVDFDSTLNVDGATVLQSTLNAKGATDLDSTLNVDGATVLQSTLNAKGSVDFDSTLNVDGDVTFTSITQSSDKDTGALITQGGVGIEKNLNVGGNTKLIGTLELDSSLIDINGSTAVGKTDYRLSSVGSGVSWRPPGVQTQNAIWVTMDGNDENSGYLEGDAKRTVGAAASIAEEGDTIFIRSGVYYENNPIGLRTDVSVSGQDLRLVTIVPNNVTKDVFHVRRGCLIENLNFAGTSASINHPNCGAVAFPPTNPSNYAVSGYISPGPATEGTSGRWRSPYVRNCTNFMTGSIGMKIDGNHATASTIGADLKSMVCDSFTQYNENGIGVSITNNGYAQLVSIFTINCDIGIYAASGGSCDLTNSNSSFGNFGLVAVGLGSTEFTGKVKEDTIAEVDTIILKEVYDFFGIARRPYDGQSLWFKINLNNYPDTVGSGVISAPLRELSSITVLNGGSGFSAASPPSIVIRDNDGTVQPKGPQGIIAEASATINDAGQITAIDVVSTGRNYLSTQNIVVDIGGNTGLATATMSPIYYTVSAATSTTSAPSGITTVTFNEFIPYELFVNDAIELRRISRILTSSHSFEYIGTGTDINTSTPLKGAVPIKENEVVAKDGAQIPFTSTDQKGNFDIGEGIQIDQTTSSIKGRDFSRAIQAEVTPLILALR